MTNGHSKKIENHSALLAISFAHYDLARVHSTVRCSPAMTVGVEPRPWSVADIVVNLLERSETGEEIGGEVSHDL